MIVVDENAEVVGGNEAKFEHKDVPVKGMTLCLLLYQDGRLVTTIPVDEIDSIVDVLEAPMVYTNRR